MGRPLLNTFHLKWECIDKAGSGCWDLFSCILVEEVFFSFSLINLNKYFCTLQLHYLV